MARRAALLLLALALVASRAFAAPTPTQALAAQRSAQQQQAAATAQATQAAQQARVTARRLNPPCFVPSSYYPLQTCKLSTSAAECGKGFNAFVDYNSCCRPGGMWKNGCTPVELWYERNLSCWIPGAFYPQQTCLQTRNLTRCMENWQRYKTEADCCKAGAAHPEGCSKPKPCWVAAEWYPARRCKVVDDQSICLRGWGAYDNQGDRCVAGAAFAEGCNAEALPVASPSAAGAPAAETSSSEVLAALNVQPAAAETNESFFDDLAAPAA